MAAWTEGSRKIAWLDTSNMDLDLYETYDHGFSFAICGPQDAKGTTPQVTPWLHCRDYFQDYVWAAIHGEKLKPEEKTAYGVDGKLPISWDPFAVLTADPDCKGDKFLKEMQASTTFLRWFERQMGLKRTKAFTVSNPKRGWGRRVVLLEASAVWLRAAPLTSMFTLLARVGMVHSPDEHPADTIAAVMERRRAATRDEDADTLREALPAIAKLGTRRGRLRYFDKNPTVNYPGEVDISDFHHHFGIASFADGQTGHWLGRGRFLRERGLTEAQRAARAVETIRAWR